MFFPLDFSDFRDIDLFVGGVSERRLAGGAMGPTFACLNGIQWFHSKFGDRYVAKFAYSWAHDLYETLVDGPDPKPR